VGAITPAICFKRVDFPAPLTPIIPSVSPLFRLKVIFLFA
jgi:hypothetical protein